MENCLAPGLDKFQSIIRSSIVFGQGNRYMCMQLIYSFNLLVVTIGIIGFNAWRGFALRPDFIW